MTKTNRTIVTVGSAALVVVAAFSVGPLLNDYLATDKDEHGHSNSHLTNKTGSLVQKDSSDYKTYSALTGDAYDSAFIKNMIVHHEGAVSMAETALTNAKRQEIKDMADDIISAQSKEILEMTQWQQKWGYIGTNNSSEHAGSHDSMGMDMANMGSALKDKSSDEFDKAFLEQMIMHHLGALNMAAPGEKNAKHDEVKELTKAVVDAQTKEIKQMQAWQKEWGF